MHRSVFILTFLILAMAACDKLPGNQGGSTPGTGGQQISTGLDLSCNGGINFGGWYMPDGDHTRSRHVNAAGPADPQVLWEFDYPAQAPEGKEVAPYMNEPLVDPDGNVYLQVSYLGESNLEEVIDKLPDNADFSQILYLTQVGMLEVLRRQTSCLLCIQAGGGLKWKSEVTDSESAGMSLLPNGFVAATTSSVYLPDRKLDKLINEIIANAKKKDFDFDIESHDACMDELDNALEAGAVQIIDAGGNTAAIFDYPDRMPTYTFTTSGSAILTSLSVDRESVPGDEVYVTLQLGILCGLALDGSELWSYSEPGFYEPRGELSNGLILCKQLYDEEPGKLLALDATNGQSTWDFDLPLGSSYFTCVDAINQRVVLIRQHNESSEKNMLYYISMDGKPLGKHPLSSNFEGEFTLLSDGSLVTIDNPFVYWKPSSDYSSPKDVPDKLTRHSPDGEVLWSREFDFADSIMKLVSDVDDVTYATWGGEYQAYLSQEVESVPAGVMAVGPNGDLLWKLELGEYEYEIQLVLGPDGTLYCVTDAKLIAIGDRQ